MDVFLKKGYSFGLAWVLLPGFSLWNAVSTASYAPVAQWIEYCPPKAGVAGSIPAGRTMFKCFQRFSFSHILPYGKCTEFAN